jgi:hypothetical protein
MTAEGWAEKRGNGSRYGAQSVNQDTSNRLSSRARRAGARFDRAMARDVGVQRQARGAGECILARSRRWLPRDALIVLDVGFGLAEEV